MLEKEQEKKNGHLNKYLQYKAVLKPMFRVMLLSEKNLSKDEQKTFPLLQKTRILIKAKVCNLIVNDPEKKQHFKTLR